jgi:hypothetical protein
VLHDRLGNLLGGSGKAALSLEVLEQDGDSELIDPTPMGQERLLLGQESKVLG